MTTLDYAEGKLGEDLHDDAQFGIILDSHSPLPSVNARNP